ncbi:hypothetical protein PPYR_01808 [Photinus pyralis]|uniref:DDE Tnp4 domain-containing protein n=1 Tax=Photinus pyralis TaxID=7054 RepID=A0A5N4B5L8_PHOPY|nr:hypothetical protein PPYR_01808 [Photinus pyralis]
MNRKTKLRHNNSAKVKAAVVAMMVAATVLDTDLPHARRWWTRPWLQRKDKGNLNLVNQEFQEDPEQFKQFLRIDEPTFNKLLELVTPYIQKKDTYFREAVSSRDKLIITLRFLATGESYRSLMYSFRQAESTISLFVPEVCRAIYHSLSEEYLKVPNTAAEWLNIAKDFQNIWNLPNVLGAMDGKHVVFKAKRSEGSSFYNYKGQHSIVLLGVVDANYQFIYVDIGTNGRVSDGGVFWNSSLASALFHDQLNFPEDKCLPGRNKPMPYVRKEFTNYVNNEGAVPWQDDIA